MNVGANIWNGNNNNNPIHSALINRGHVGAHFPPRGPKLVNLSLPTY